MTMADMKFKQDANIYEIVPITSYKFIYEDLAKVIDMIGNTLVSDYITNMRQSVDQGLAYDIRKNGERVGFVYNREENGRYYGASIYVWDSVAMFLAMKHMFEISDKHKITFIPHGDNWKYFKSMIDGRKIRMFYSGANDVTITRDIVDKAYGIKMFRYLGLELA